MPNIDIYAGHRKKRNRHEEIVLSRVLNLLVKHATDAVIFCDIWLDDHQVDILVGTETTTVQLEVKGWGCAVRAQQNGDWEVTYADGSVYRRDNAYLQALTNNQKLRNEMARYLGEGIEVPFPNGAVLFEPRIHPDSQFDMRPDPRVVIRGADQLEDLLNTPSPSPWRLPWMRGFAEARKFIRLPLPEPDNESDRQPVDHWRQDFVIARDSVHEGGRRLAVVDGRRSIERERDYFPSPIRKIPPTPVTEATSTEYVSIGSARTIAIPSYPRGGARRSRSLLRRLLRLTPLLCVLIVAAYAFKVSFPFVHKAASSRIAVVHRASGRHSDTKRVSEHQRARAVSANTTPTHTADASAEATLPNAPNSTYGISTPPAPITCPAGVDRLGCNGRVGTFGAPECPAGFSASGSSCIRAGGG